MHSKTIEIINDTSFPLADANGNCVSFIDEASNVQAHYTYDVFGNTVSQTGAMADDFPFRFSSKYLDDETGLLYYGFRYFAPALGRWVNRDPIEERGGLNVYGFVGNHGINNWDFMGLDEGGTGLPPIGDVCKFIATEEGVAVLGKYCPALGGPATVVSFCASALSCGDGNVYPPVGYCWLDSQESGYNDEAMFEQTCPEFQQLVACRYTCVNALKPKDDKRETWPYVEYHCWDPDQKCDEYFPVGGTGNPPARGL